MDIAIESQPATANSFGADPDGLTEAVDRADAELYARFRQLGLKHKLQARQLMGLLGQLVRRDVPRRTGYLTVVEFAVDRVVLARSGGVCEARDCRKPEGVAHHVQFWSANPNHNHQQMLYV